MRRIDEPQPNVSRVASAPQASWLSGILEENAFVRGALGSLLVIGGVALLPSCAGDVEVTGDEAAPAAEVAMETPSGRLIVVSKPGPQGTIANFGFRFGEHIKEDVIITVTDPQSDTPIEGVLALNAIDSEGWTHASLEFSDHLSSPVPLSLQLIDGTPIPIVPFGEQVPAGSLAVSGATKVSPATIPE